MSSLSKRYRAARPDPVEFAPPNLAVGAEMPFEEPQRTRLHSWLQEAGWTRGQMQIAELEGYLVALLAWPVGISPGAWLPRIWGERGWKVPAKIAQRLEYDEFIALIVGFLQDLDRRLSLQPSRFESSVLRALQGPSQREGLHCWGRGFMTALTLGSQGLKCRSDSAGAAVRVIAGNTCATASFGSSTIEEVVSSVLELMKQRATRGPLGPLDMPASVPKSARTVG
jgi:yecA family protein